MRRTSNGGSFRSTPRFSPSTPHDPTRPTPLGRKNGPNQAVPGTTSPPGSSRFLLWFPQGLGELPVRVHDARDGPPAHRGPMRGISGHPGEGHRSSAWEDVWRSERLVGYTLLVRSESVSFVSNSIGCLYSLYRALEHNCKSGYVAEGVYHLCLLINGRKLKPFPLPFEVPFWMKASPSACLTLP